MADVTRLPAGVAILCALGVAARLRPVERPAGRPGSGMQPIIATLILMVAGRGIAQLITGGQIITIYYPPVLVIWQWLPARRAGRAVIAPRGRRGARAAHRAPRSACSSRRSAGIPRARGSPGFASRAASRSACTRSVRPLRRDRRPDRQLQRQERRRQQRGPLLELDAILAVTLAAPRSPAAGSPFGGTLGALIIQTLTYDDLLARRAARGQPGGEGVVVFAVMHAAVEADRRS